MAWPRQDTPNSPRQEEPRTRADAEDWSNRLEICLTSSPGPVCAQFQCPPTERSVLLLQRAAAGCSALDSLPAAADAVLVGVARRLLPGAGALASRGTATGTPAGARSRSGSPPTRRLRGSGSPFHDEGSLPQAQRVPDRARRARSVAATRQNTRQGRRLVREHDAGLHKPCSIGRSPFPVMMRPEGSRSLVEVPQRREPISVHPETAPEVVT